MTEMNERAKELRATILKCIRDHLNAKLEKLKPDEDDARAKLEATHEPETWLAAAAKQAVQIQLATHIIKPIHSSARGTDLQVTPRDVGAVGLAGTHSIQKPQADVAVRNAAALYIYGDFLAVEHDGQPLWNLALTDAENFQSALSDDPVKAEEWRRAFAEFAVGKARLASDALAKQLYFPLPNSEYHLLAPLFPTSLIHEAYSIMREDRFGNAAKAAREARKKGEGFAHGYREYPDIAIQKLGGDNSQNVSQLINKRHGENWLLASLPPTWASSEVRPPLNSESVFPTWFGRRPLVRELTNRLRQFLTGVSYNNVAIRRHRASLVQQICDEVYQYAARLEGVPAGWTADSQCRLNQAERLWLDPGRSQDDEEFAKQRQAGDWIGEVSHRFANWLNARLTTKGLTLGEDEHTQWKVDLAKELEGFRDALEIDHD